MRRMRRATGLAVITLALLAGSARSARATEVGGSRNFGLGFALGGPSSLVGKYYLGGENAFDFGISFWDYYDDCPGNPRLACDNGYGPVGFNLDYLWQDTLARGSAKLDWHIGAGGRIWVGDRYYRDDRHGRVALAARMPIGLDLTFAKPSFLETFLELAPDLYIVPGLFFNVEAMIGVRFYF
jgi:hypothetical protein